MDVVSGSATLTTTATTTSPAGTYPITFTTEALAATNYTFAYKAGTLTVTAVGATAPPSFSPAGGTFTTAQSVMLSDATAGSSIYYTTNGTTPSSASTPYTGPISVTATETIEAIAYLNGVASNVTSATYTIDTSGQCTVINYGGGFTSTGLKLNGGATVTAKMLQLTDGKDAEARSAFYSKEVPLKNFTTDFTFRLLNPVADGFAFVIQANSASALGTSGGGLGYGGIKNSAAIKFDLYNNSGEGVDSTGLYFNGAAPTTPAIKLAPSGIDLHSGHVFAAHLTYVGTTATFTLTDTVTKAVYTTSIMVQAWTNSVNAYVGFTAGTGASTATQNILSWTYSAGTNCGK